MCLLQYVCHDLPQYGDDDSTRMSQPLLSFLSMVTMTSYLPQHGHNDPVTSSV